MKLKDVSDWDKPDAILDKEGNVLCPICKKNLAIVSKHGMIRNCEECKDVRNEAPGYSFVDANGFKCR